VVPERPRFRLSKVVFYIPPFFSGCVSELIYKVYKKKSATASQTTKFKAAGRNKKRLLVSSLLSLHIPSTLIVVSAVKPATAVSETTTSTWRISLWSCFVYYQGLAKEVETV
jgi:hypothetical protein